MVIRTLIFVSILALFGCVKPQIKTETVYITEYKDVYVPVKCKVEIPSKPTIDNESLPVVLNSIFKTYDELVALLEYCKGDDNVE